MLPQKAIKSKKKSKLPFWQQPTDEQLSQTYAAEQAAKKISRSETKKQNRKLNPNQTNEDPFQSRDGYSKNDSRPYSKNESKPYSKNESKSYSKPENRTSAKPYSKPQPNRQYKDYDSYFADKPAQSYNNDKPFKNDRQNQSSYNKDPYKKDSYNKDSLRNDSYNSRNTRNSYASQDYTPLFSSANEFSQEALVLLEKAIHQVVRQTSSQRKALKGDIIELSQLLTSERTELSAPYWTVPSLMAAYINFFMPWNVVRLGQLLPNLDMPEVEDGDYVLDLGSGPITCIIALWIARPDYRKKRLNIIATDVVLKPMELGLEVFRALADLLNEPLLWNIELHRQSFTQALDRHSSKLRAKAKVILSANILNEVESRQKLQNSELREIFNAYSYSIRKNLHEDGTYIAIEPGTRQGGRLVTLLREESFDSSLAPHAPCTHNQPCPFQENRRISSWCHMQCPAHAPVWLKDLAYNSGFRRRTLSLSFVQLKTYQKRFKENSARLVSNPFEVPQYGACHYICSEHGLGMLVQENNNPRAPQVDIPHSAKVQIAPTHKRDRKSQALIAYLD